MTKNIQARSKGERILFGFCFVLFSLYALTLIFPFAWCFISSFKKSIVSNLWGIPKVWRWQNWSEALIREEIEQFIRVLNNPEWENVLFDFFIKDLTYTEIEKQRGYAWGVPKNITALACVRLAQLWTCKKYIKEFKEENN